MSYPVLLRRAGGVAALVAVACGVGVLFRLFSHGATVGFFALVFFVPVTMPSLVAMPFLYRTARRVARGQHQGDYLLIFSLLYSPAIVVVALTDGLAGLFARIALGCLVGGLVLYAAGALSKHHPPG